MLLLLAASCCLTLCTAAAVNTTSSPSHSTYNHPDPSLLLSNSTAEPDLNGTENTNLTDPILTLDPFDFVQCDPLYGDSLVADSCRDVLINIFNVRIPRPLAVIRQAAFTAATNLQVPVEYRDRDSECALAE